MPPCPMTTGPWSSTGSPASSCPGPSTTGAAPQRRGQTSSRRPRTTGARRSSMNRWANFCRTTPRPCASANLEAKDGAGEQAVEHVDGAMVEVMGAELLHLPRADDRKREDSSTSAPWLPTNERSIAVAGGKAQGSSGARMETHL